VYEPVTSNKTAGGICPVVKELTEKMEGKKCQINTYMCDAMKLSQHFKNIANVINVDPPYYDQHIYSDFSEFFWPILKTMLEPAIPLLFDKKVLIDWTPKSWTVPKSNEIIARDSSKRLFEIRLEKALKEMREALKDNGLLIFWFSHKSMDAWRATIEALNKAKFSITAIIPLPSEHPTRSITRGGRVGMNRVLIIILKNFEEYLRKSKIYPAEIISEEEIRLLTTAATYALSRC
jgi:adenine-specific DNA methylase